MLFWLTGLLLNSGFPYPAKHMRSDFRPWSSSSIFLRSWVTGTSFFRDPTYLNPSTTAGPRTRGSVRRASGFVQIAIFTKNHTDSFFVRVALLALLQHLPQRRFVFEGGLSFLLQVGDDLFRPRRADPFSCQLFYGLHRGELLLLLIFGHRSKCNPICRAGLCHNCFSNTKRAEGDGRARVF